MYNCRNCGGNLRFDISIQKLKCPYCTSTYDCYEVEEAQAAVGDTSYMATVFSCPQCGAAIVSSDESIADFCTYCGSSVVFDARLKKQARPQKIIPFKITAQDCKNAYTSKIRGSVFAPSALKDPDFIERFRGIYIPYWSYGFTNKGPINLTSSHSYRSGDYDVTDYYQVDGTIDASYDGLCYDASSSFDDTISAAIAPFDPKDMKDFVPSYLSGFCADIADVPSRTYLKDANEMANTETLRAIQEDPGAGKYTLSTSSGLKTMNQNLSTTALEPVSALFPVWFLSWRNRDRVAYMTVNGQTGKVSADIPIDVRKYILASLVAAIPLYFVLNLLFSFIPSTSLFLAGLFALISGFIYYEEVGTIMEKDNRVHDAGYQYKMKRKKKAKKKKGSAEGPKKTQVTKEAPAKTEETTAAPTETGETKEAPAETGETAAGQGEKEELTEGLEKKGVSTEAPEEKEKLTGDPGKKSFGQRAVAIASIAFTVITLLVFAVIALSEDIISAIFNRYTLNFVLLTAAFIFWYAIWDDGSEELPIRQHREIFGSQVAVIAACLINIVHPVSDIYYYIGMIFAYLGIFSTLIRVMTRYNLLITRPIPQFHNRGKEKL